ncbi:BrnA antitoxin family protein [Azohydromonas lata]|uniref:BrnA antitoxin family protein n=1 Tax=Azohydromonas lata TaxID=45677 RepID=UPI000831B15D|nr:BrnA antitoxin family protein [Azohydromonas lata]
MGKLKPGTIWPTPEEEKAINAGIAADSDNPELDDEWFKKAKPASEFFDKETYEGLVALKRRPGQRGPQKAPRKLAVTVRYDPEVIEAFRASGEGWQTRMNEALKDWLKTHPQAR